MISVVIIAHNRREFLKTALEACLQQELSPKEVIVVDDGSRPPLEAFVNEVAASLPGLSVRTIYTPDIGPPGARHAGAKASTGEVLAFLDDDDSWDSKYLKTASEKLVNEDSDLVVTWMKSIYSDGTIGKGKEFSFEMFKKSPFVKNFGTVGSNIVVKRDSYFEVGGFDEGLLASEDKDLVIQFYLNKKKISVVDSPLVNYRIHNSASQLSGLTSFNRFKESGKEAFLKKYSSNLSNVERAYLTAELAYIRYFRSSNWSARAKNFLKFSRHPEFFKRYIGHLSRKVRC